MFHNNINPEELLSSHGIEYKSHGDSLKCYCFFHDETNASFSINKTGGYYYCFSCGAKGSIFNLYELVTGERLKIDSKTYSNYQWNRNYGKQKKQERIDNTDIEIKVFGKLLPVLENKEIRKWLYDFGLEDDQYITDRQITYSPYTEMVSNDFLLDTSIEYTKIANRVTIPIYKNGRIINYECRTYVGHKPKVLYPRGGLKTTVYGWEWIDSTKDLIVTEGIKNSWKIQNINSNVVALMGNQILDEQAEMLNSVEGTIIAFLDNDGGGLGRYDEKGKFIPGMLQNLEAKLTKEFRVCYNPIEGADATDTEYSLIEKLISKAKPYNEILVDSVISKKEVRGW